MGLLQSLCFIIRRWLRTSGVSRLLCCLHFHANIHDSRYDCYVTSCRLTIWSHPGHDGGHLQCQCWGILLLLPVQACWSSTCLMDVAWEAPILQGWGWSFKDSPFPSSWLLWQMVWNLIQSMLSCLLFQLYKVTISVSSCFLHGSD